MAMVYPYLPPITETFPRKRDKFMAAARKRKPLFILGFFVVLALAVSILVLRDIPAPVTEQTIELDAANVLRQ